MCAFVFYMSDQPAVDSTEMSMEIVDQIVRFFVPGYDQMDAAAQLAAAKGVEHIVRKVAHFCEYALLGLLAFNLVRRIARAQGPKPSFLSRFGTVVAWAGTTAYAVTDEIHQMFVPGRACMVGDVVIDSAGALFGILVYIGVALLLRRRPAK